MIKKYFFTHSTLEAIGMPVEVEGLQPDRRLLVLLGDDQIIAPRAAGSESPVKKYQESSSISSNHAGLGVIRGVLL